MKPKLGSGKRFASLSAALAAKGAHDPDAEAAAIGRRTYGKAKFQKLASHGRKRAARKAAARVAAPKY